MSRTPLEALADTFKTDTAESRLTVVLMHAWAQAEPNHTITHNPASYVATFLDMARAALEEKNRG